MLLLQLALGVASVRSEPGDCRRHDRFVTAWSDPTIEAQVKLLRFDPRRLSTADFEGCTPSPGIDNADVEISLAASIMTGESSDSWGGAQPKEGAGESPPVAHLCSQPS